MNCKQPSFLQVHSEERKNVPHYKYKTRNNNEKPYTHSSTPPPPHPPHPTKQQQTVQSDMYSVIVTMHDTIPLSTSKCSQNTNQQRIWKLNFSNPSAIFMSWGQLQWHARSSDTSVCICVYVYVYVCMCGVCVCVCMWMCLCICKHVCVCYGMRVRVCVHKQHN